MEHPSGSPEFYHPLALDFIRVFELEVGNISDPVVGRLVPQAIDGEPYEAVSYVWGDRWNRRDISVDGLAVSVTANLHGALTAFRPRPSVNSAGRDPGTGQEQRQVRRLWIDAVCINQGDLSERTSQVQLMARIFAGASHVLAWLGWEEDEGSQQHVQSAINFIHDFMKDSEAGLREARILLHHHDVTEPAERLVDLSEDDRQRFEAQARIWESVKAFFEIEYFHRTWVVQELGLAQEATLYSALKPHDRAKPVHLELHSVSWPLVGRFARFLDYSGALLVTHLGLRSWVVHHTWMAWETEEDGAPRWDFLTTMHWVRIHGVTDARDRVYSLLGHPLAVLDGDVIVKPDYTITRGVIYTRLAANIIKKTKNLHVVNFVDHEYGPYLGARDWDPQDDSRMPSWVPDWHSINRTAPMHYPIDAAENEDAEISIEGGIEGSEGTLLPHLLVRGWIVDEITAVSRRMETIDFPVSNAIRERAKDNPFWLDHLWEFLAPPQSFNNCDALAVLETLSLALSFGTMEEDQPVSNFEPRQTLEEHRRSFAACILEYHELLHGMLKASGLEDDSTLPARSLYDSLPVEAQGELRRRAQGTTSERFLQSMTWQAMCRVVYRTASGHVGIGSRITLPGDLVCRVRGSPLLMTLRRMQAGPKMKMDTKPNTDTGCYAYIGPTIVPARQQKHTGDSERFNEQAVHFRIL